MSWLFLAGAIASEVAATMALRASEGFRRKAWIAPVAIGYLTAFVMLGFSLAAGMPVGVAYGTWAALGIASTVILARLIFREPLTRRMMLGILLIILGVAAVEIGAYGVH
ncbi:multidrug efflux SMR transporter [Microbacterium sp.]|uniref:DMT family transporter n=1 Tax=Microbacterium sp. TaxID=51671 RepID=UPI00356AF215